MIDSEKDIYDYRFSVFGFKFLVKATWSLLITENLKLKTIYITGRALQLACRLRRRGCAIFALEPALCELRAALKEFWSIT
jgi:hypothetical protein